ncbi:MAG: hypothetical protein ACLUNZ_02605 [Evtepia sp.]
MRPVWGYRPAAATSRQVISSGWWRSVVTTDIFLATVSRLAPPRALAVQLHCAAQGRSWRTMVFENGGFPRPVRGR